MVGSNTHLSKKKGKDRTPRIIGKQAGQKTPPHLVRKNGNPTLLRTSTTDSCTPTAQ